MSLSLTHSSHCNAYRFSLVRVIAALVIAIACTVSPSALADDNTDYQEQLKALAKSIHSLKAELNNAKSSKNKLQKSLQMSEEDISNLTKKITDIKEALAREKKRLAQLQAKRTELDTHKQNQKQQISQILRQTYQLGQQSQLKLLLNQENPERIHRLLKYHNYIVSAHQQEIRAYTDTISQIDAIKHKITQSNQQLEKRHQQLAKRQQSLQSSQKQRVDILRQLTQSLSKKGQQLDTLIENRQHLQDLLDKATNALAHLSLPSDAIAFTQVRGKLPMPTKGKIIYRYGSSQFDGKLKRNGIFISNRMGANVVSVHHGRVIFSDYLRGHGLLLIIDHGNGYMSLYGHNQTLIKETGEWVGAGENIATVGNSGGQQRTGLYFEIRHQGQPQNPQNWLASK